MVKRMTVTFDDEVLYTALITEAAREGRHSSDIVVEAIRDWLATQEDDHLRPGLEEARRGWEREGGVDAHDFFANRRPGALRQG